MYCIQLTHSCYSVSAAGCCRIGVTDQSPVGQVWGEMKTPGAAVLAVALGPGHRGWILDNEGRIYFRLGVCAEYPQGSDLKWWQV